MALLSSCGASRRVPVGEGLSWMKSKCRSSRNDANRFNLSGGNKDEFRQMVEVILIRKEKDSLSTIGD